jgi:hypothetical protein
MTILKPKEIFQSTLIVQSGVIAYKAVRMGKPSIAFDHGGKD